MEYEAVVQFRALYVPQSLSAKLQRAVLARSWGRGSKCNALPCGHRILRRYRRVLASLAPYWKPASDAANTQRVLVNCPPTHFVPIREHRGSICRYRFICPWCHARWVRELWELFEFRMWPDKADVRSAYSFYADEVLPEMVDARSYQLWLRQVKSQFKMPPIPDFEGYVAWAVLAPYDAEASWNYQKVMGVTTNHTRDSNKLIHPTRLDVARVFAKYLAFPKTMATADPRLIATVLDAQAGHQLCNRYGVLRLNPQEAAALKRYSRK